MFAQPTWTMQYRPNFTRELVSTAPRPSGQPHKAPVSAADGQLDPNELTRRLYVVLAEQKAYAERRQRAHRTKDGLGASSSTRHRDGLRTGRQKPAEPPADLITELRRTESARRKQAPHMAAAVPASDAGAIEPPQYHHVPKEAAKQFTRTTTVENMRNSSDLVHKLSKRALQFHTDGPKTVRPGGGGGGNGNGNGSSETAITPAELSRALQQTQTQRDRLLERNQFQRSRILEEAARQDHHQEQQSPRKHTFQDEFSRILPGGGGGQQNKHLRRNSTGNSHHNNAMDYRHQPPPEKDIRRSLLAAPDMMGMLMDPLLEEDMLLMRSMLTPPPEKELGRFPPPDRARVDWTQSDQQQQPPAAAASASASTSRATLLPQQPLNNPRLLGNHLLPDPLHPLPLLRQQKPHQLAKLAHPVARVTGVRPGLAQRLGALAQADVPRPRLLLSVSPRVVVARDGAQAGEGRGDPG
ncbi:hypothetical protein C8A00DRAFT_42941 [Chaetomidium leptoderma]|uniref:Uncharacterized protein n=1 Tax=Chaetomidium leptoderma TaxID=669021 RepID=A0AAN6ZXW7_9PEZI|nr:hypothetical protein C8A00DRAFT_42941 [Chaetomidium leptoderma]